MATSTTAPSVVADFFDAQLKAELQSAIDGPPGDKQTAARALIDAARKLEEHRSAAVVMDADLESDQKAMATLSALVARASADLRNERLTESERLIEEARR